MDATLYVNTSTFEITSTLTGAVLPDVRPRLQQHLKLTVYFHDGTTAALIAGASFRVALKSAIEPSGTVLALVSSASATNADNYEFEWTSIDSAALRSLVDDNDNAAAVLEIEWTVGSDVERASMPVTIGNAWIRTADAAPDFLPFAATITALGYLRLVNSDGDVFHIGLNTGEPPSS